VQRRQRSKRLPILAVFKTLGDFDQLVSTTNCANLSTPCNTGRQMGGSKTGVSETSRTGRERWRKTTRKKKNSIDPEEGGTTTVSMVWYFSDRLGGKGMKGKKGPQKWQVIRLGTNRPTREIRTKRRQSEQVKLQTRTCCKTKLNKNKKKRERHWSHARGRTRGAQSTSWRQPFEQTSQGTACILKGSSASTGTKRRGSKRRAEENRKPT